MGDLFRKVTVKAGRKIESRKWYAHLRDELGRRKAVPLSPDKDIARRMLADLERKAERRRAGIHDDFDDHAARPVADHLADYRRHLAAKGSADHVAAQIDHIRLILADGRIERLADLTAPRQLRTEPAQRASTRIALRFLGDPAAATGQTVQRLRCHALTQANARPSPGPRRNARRGLRCSPGGRRSGRRRPRPATVGCAAVRCRPARSVPARRPTGS